MNEMEKLVDNGFCIGCGACGVINDKLIVSTNESGMYQLSNPKEATSLDYKVCPFLSEVNENVISSKLFSSIPEIKFDENIGYYSGLYAGHVKNDDMRLKSSSGGLTTWLLEELFNRGDIDAVVHVGSKSSSENLFGFRVSRSLSEIKKNAKSRYYPVEFKEAIQEIKNDLNLSRIVFVGIPCHLKAIRLLCNQDRLLSSKVSYLIGIFCGHMKSRAFAELVGWQQGIRPHELNQIDFRYKGQTGRAGRYFLSVKSASVESKTINSKLFGTDWGLGLFKPKACDWCDDVGGEVGDIVFGDAWIEHYDEDEKGNNIVIARNLYLESILKEGFSSGEISLDEVTVDDVIKSQSATFRHRREGLAVRIQNKNDNNEWHPQKRVDVSLAKNVSKKRRSVYLLREKISKKSHDYFITAKSKDNLYIFFLMMLPSYLKYCHVNNSLLKGTAKFIYFLIKAAASNFKKVLK
ncbi:Coenzyme F420 hydrogenase/dehydrogenase, beta subunit C-terminal domain [Shewanella insulae]|uniref:Coenzyme F420 hydrogenase/dehydrogenase, beta subunit C-terminal domain n=1 Tax=Shewanella insulae TaxID=2681496 RepID=UPI001EFC516B|nr:Coenzyme F420 hydrogenase/dehydrogenase, beta subunit C-terminal domain [Shewanella insulae]MCG9757464.1 Coenzyme F420 hydrogenase/dehydrogenase, beta subunit C-terminal domain [Shewanella insulae]